MREKKLPEIIVLNLIGIFLYTVGIRCFAAPAGIAPGGSSGIAILVNYVTGFPVGLFTSLFSLPILALVWWKKIFPPVFAVRAACSIIGLSVMTDMLEPVLPKFGDDPLLAALFAGAFMGLGLGFVYLGNSDTGGITMIGLILQRYFPQLKVGALVSSINICIVLASGLVYHDIRNILYAAVTVYVSGQFMDMLVNNSNSKDLMIVMSECTDKVRCVFLEEKKGITILKGEGGYTSETQRVIMGAASRADCAHIRQRIQEVDPHALIIVAEANNVIGKEFGRLL